MIKKLGLVLVTAIATLALMLTGCERTESTASREIKETEALMSNALDEIGTVNITNFYEKKLAKTIFEKRDDSDLICYVYTVDRDGFYNYIGRCMGYGLPYATQYTAPTVDTWKSSGAVITTVQAEPNGLYSGEGSSGTWLLMLDETTGDTYVEYNETEVIITEAKKEKYTLSELSLKRIEENNIDY